MKTLRAASPLWLICIGLHAQDTPEKLIEQVRQNMANYDKQLPNFFCQEMVNRYYDPNEGTEWRFIDLITAQLTYFEGQEKYTQVRVNDKLVSVEGLKSLRGSMAEGDFGSLLRDIFQPGGETRFDWERRKKLRGHSTSVFKYEVKKENSHYTIYADTTQRYVSAYQGEIFVDEETKMVLRVMMSAIGIPSHFPVRSVSTTLDYEFANVGGRQYLLPARSEVVSQNHSISIRNIEEFRQYRKFTADSTLTFDGADAKP